jgi:hypothetical protein
MISKKSVCRRLLNWRRNRSVALTAALATFIALPAIAEESPIPITPAGGTDLSQAILPPKPGLYGSLIAIPYNENFHIYGYNEKPVPPQSNLTLQIPLTAAAFLYEYPFQIWGGRVASSVVVSFWDLNYQFAGGAIQGHEMGLADTYSDLIYWSKNVGLFGVVPGNLALPYGLNVAAGLGLKLPTGVYNPSNFANIGGNLWVVIPNVALTYVTGPNLSLGDSTEISARLFFGVPFENPATGYSSGEILDIDWSATERFGNFRAGVAGFYQGQLTEDSRASGIPVANGGRFSHAGLGPIVEYRFPDSGLTIKAKYQRQLYDQSFTDTQYFALTLSGKLY